MIQSGSEFRFEMRPETMQTRDPKKKKKKAWRRIISFLLTFKQKSGEEEEAPLSTEPSKLSCSGRLFAHLLQQRVRLTPSGTTLSSCFAPSMAEEDSEVPYKCLEHQNHALGAKPFGPIYLIIVLYLFNGAGAGVLAITALLPRASTQNGQHHC